MNKHKILKYLPMLLICGYGSSINSSIIVNCFCRKASLSSFSSALTNGKLSNKRQAEFALTIALLAYRNKIKTKKLHTNLMEYKRLHKI